MLSILDPLTHTADLEERGYDEGGKIKHNPEEFFEIDALDGKGNLLEIMKEQNVVETLGKLLDSSNASTE